ncbi:winged helix-turn-helix domain-containing protein [Longimicrobium sp.]|uniref:winged helix-turn-helix domain-containing protein n=1 Tax=Longimicrobium sp. TaxID=2029185 RepID=UPI002CD7C2F2|nr:winged helix-turn-helix domain-containing protein [Longimicrobium sp.]HSU14183.1 winged helix-turn-helix domain-containing protein [Longimicrobium sp.]
MEPDAGLSDRLRDRILNALHLGLLRPGDRLPSIRTLWREMGVDHRVVAQAYRTLEAEGLVEVRGRSGVYLAPQDQFGGELLAETARWLAGVLVEAWKRRLTIADVPELIRRCTQTATLRCACVESNEDQMTAYTAELQEQFGLDPYPVRISHLPLPRPERSVEFHWVEDELRKCDLVVTTSYHARLVRKAAENVGIPAVVLTVNPDVVETIQKRLREGPLTVVAVEPSFGDRMRAMYADETPERVRVVLAGDREGLRALDPDEPVLLTRAARQSLGPDDDLPMLLPHSPTFSPHTARELLGVIIRLNLEAAAASDQQPVLRHQEPVTLDT